MTWVKDDLPADERHVAVLLGVLFRELATRMPTADWGGLRQSHLRVLSAVPAAGITVTELGRRVGMTTQGCGQFVAHLTGVGHLRTERDPGDRRRRIVVRTASGSEAVRASTAFVRAVEQDWAARVGADRYAVFRAVLDELTLGERAGPGSAG